jgi:hypothetical protein
MEKTLIHGPYRTRRRIWFVSLSRMGKQLVLCPLAAFDQYLFTSPTGVFKCQKETIVQSMSNCTEICQCHLRAKSGGSSDRFGSCALRVLPATGARANCAIRDVQVFHLAVIGPCDANFRTATQGRLTTQFFGAVSTTKSARRAAEVRISSWLGVQDGEIAAAWTEASRDLVASAAAMDP